MLRVVDDGVTGRRDDQQSVGQTSNLAVDLTFNCQRGRRRYACPGNDIVTGDVATVQCPLTAHGHGNAVTIPLKH